MRSVIPKEAATDQSLARFLTIRQLTESLCAPLEAEDYVIQSMPDASPTKWHLAHTSWFFETFLLKPHLEAYREFDARFSYLFNSYYNAIGDRHCRQHRGLLSRPTVRDIYAYRAHVDQGMRKLLQSAPTTDLAALLDIGLHHEQQHQELMLTDIKHVFWVNPLWPAYVPATVPVPSDAPTAKWIRFDGGLHEIGHQGDGFAFDNEGPRHRVYAGPFNLASRLVTNREFQDFINDDGYRRPELWLSAGWAAAQADQWSAPLYWIRQGEQWRHHTLSGLRPLADGEPVCHVSLFEADAYARWADARLATEAEWEIASAPLDPTRGQFLESRIFHPTVAGADAELQQMFGTLWQWTGSAYLAYPGYRPAPGALGEYNGKFMCNQFVLRGGSIGTSRTHIRNTYRNFFPPDARWQFSGIRLARDV